MNEHEQAVVPAGLPLAGAGSAAGAIKITRIAALEVAGQGTFIKIETDAGLVGYGECGAKGPLAREALAELEGGRLPHLGLVGKDPLAIGVHYHNMFHAYPQRGRYVRVYSGVDIALWDLAGKILGRSVATLLGGPFRDEIALYSHCTGGDYFDPAAWRERVAELTEDGQGFNAFKVDIQHSLGIRMQEAIPSIGPRDARRLGRAYELAREAFGPDNDIIVHCHCELDAPSAIRVAAQVEPIAPLFYEDPLAPNFSEAWVALRRATRLPLMTGENLELPEQVLPFLQHSAIDVLQPDLINSGGITGTKRIADLAALYHVPVCLHNVRGPVLAAASQQWSAAVFNCPLMECRRNAAETAALVGTTLTIRDGRMRVADRPGLGVELDPAYLQAHMAAGEPWWG